MGFGLAGSVVNLMSFVVDHYSVYIYLSSISIAVTTPLFFYLVESPFYLYKNMQIKKLYKCLLKICERNHSRDGYYAKKSELSSRLKYGKFFDSDYNNQDKSNRIALVKSKHEYNLYQSDEELTNSKQHLLDQKKTSNSRISESENRRNFIIFLKLIWIFTQAECIGFMSMLVNKQIGISSDQISGLFIVFFQISGHITGILLVPRLGRRTINILNSVIISLFSLLILAADLISNHFTEYIHRSKYVRLVEIGKPHKCSLF